MVELPYDALRDMKANTMLLCQFGYVWLPSGFISSPTLRHEN